jgi:hypothetical protein
VIQANPNFSVPYILHAAALVCLGRDEDAKAVVQRLVEVQPGITYDTVIRQMAHSYANPEHSHALENALRRAGLPER